MNQFISYKIKAVSTEELKKHYNPSFINNFCSQCPEYGKIWTCPPLPFKDIDYISNKKYCYVISSKIIIDKIPKDKTNDYIKNSLGRYKDISLLDDDNSKIFNALYYAFREFMDDKLLQIEKTYPDSTVLISGRCLKCRECTRLKNLPCVHTELLRYSLEALGFDVSSVIEGLFNDKIQWSSDRSPEYVTCVSALLTDNIISENELYEKLCK